MVTKKRNEDTFVFLKQYRHAPRKIQYSFPRGFAEDGILSIDNAKKELLEEMGVEKLMEDPVFIGTISPDSGLTSSCVNVYLVELEEYSTNISHEGIIGVQEISFDDLKNWLEENHRKIKPGNRFDDGFTLAALELYKTNCRQN